MTQFEKNTRLLDFFSPGNKYLSFDPNLFCERRTIEFKTRIKVIIFILWRFNKKIVSNSSNSSDSSGLSGGVIYLTSLHI